jgi:hypothetical protein
MDMNTSIPLPRARFDVVCYGRDGGEKWRDVAHNLVTDAGINDVLDKYLKGSSYSAGFFVGLTDGTPTAAAGDTMSSHAGWTEITAYSESTREALTLGTVASKTVNNSASKATFSISSDSQTIGGCFVVTDSTKGGTSGTLLNIAPFSGGDKSADDGDSLEVTVTYTGSDV